MREIPSDVDVVVVGGGQAGLGMSYRLREAGISHIVLDDRARTGDVWRERWDSLVLFTPKRFAALAGSPLPRDADTYPTRLQLADYLERYAAEHGIPVAHRTRVTRIARADATDGDARGRFAIAYERDAHPGIIYAQSVVIATGPFQYPRVPRVAAGLDDDVVQVHSSAYRRPADLPTGRIAVVGGGNSAAQLAVELATAPGAEGREVTMIAPAEPWFIPERVAGVSVYWPLSAFGILDSPAESRISRYIHSRGDGILGTEAKKLVRRGTLALRTSRVVGAAGRALGLKDGSRVEVDAVLWCTGFRAHYPFVAVDGALSEHGTPRHERGVSPVDGVYWIGLPWQTRLDSSILHGIDADARELTAAIIAARGTDAPRTSASMGL